MSKPIAALLLVAVLACGPGRSAGSPASVPVPADSLRAPRFHPERVFFYRDSFHLFEHDAVAGYDRLVGWRRTVMSARAGGFRYVEEEGTAHGRTKALEVMLDSALGVRAARSAGRFFGRTVASNVAYEGGRARGAADAAFPGDSGAGGQRLRMPVDTLLPAGAFDALALLALVLLLDWEAGAAYLLPVFDPAESSITYQVLRIGEPERIAGPAGIIEAWPAELTTNGRPLRLWVSTESPHRLIRLDSEAGRVRMALVAPSPPLGPLPPKRN